MLWHRGIINWLNQFCEKSQTFVVVFVDSGGMWLVEQSDPALRARARVQNYYFYFCQSGNVTGTSGQFWEIQHGGAATFWNVGREVKAHMKMIISLMCSRQVSLTPPPRSPLHTCSTKWRLLTVDVTVDVTVDGCCWFLSTALTDED